LPFEYAPLDWLREKPRMQIPAKNRPNFIIYPFDMLFRQMHGWVSRG
jgi:hypothetical protein